MNSLFERLRSRRLTSVFILLASVSAAILAVSFAAYGVHGQENQTNSSDATPLKIVTTPTPPNDFVRLRHSRAIVTLHRPESPGLPVAVAG